MEATGNITIQSPGEVLAAERERQGLAPADVAQKLHLSVWQIEALEAGDYARLPRGPFLRGFVRNYAKVLNVPSDALLASLAEGGPRDPAPRIVVPNQNIRFDPLSDRFANPYVKAAGVSAVVIAVGFAAMYWWLFVRPTPSAPIAQKTSKPAPTPSPAAAVPAVPPVPVPVARTPEPTPTPTPTSVPTPAPTTTTTTTTPATKPSPISVPATKPSPISAPTLRFQFKGRSWVEIRDGAGKVLLTGTNPADTQAEVTGQPPFRVIVGNAPEVRMFFNDREFDLEPHTREAVARLTVE